MNESGMEKIEDWNYYTANQNLIIEKGHRQNTSGERKLRSQLYHYYDGFTNHKLTSGLEVFWMGAGPDFTGENYTISAKSLGSGNYGQNKTRYMQQKNLGFVALFLEDTWKISDKTTAFIGARYEDHSLTSPNISPRIAVSHDYSEKTNFKLLYSKGFRTPDWQYFSVNRNATTPVADPKPEKVDSFEGHVTHHVDQKLSFTTIGYYTIYNDLINYWSSGYRNFPTVRAIGLEFSGDYKTENIKTGVSHSYSRPYHISDDNFDQVSLSYDGHNWAQFPTNMTKAHSIIHLVKDKCMLGTFILASLGHQGTQKCH